MKIAYIHNCLWPSNSPGVNFVTYNAEGFGNAGYDISLFVKNNSKQPTEEILNNLFNIKKINFNLERINTLRFLDTNHVYFYKVYNIIKYNPFDVLTQLRLAIIKCQRDNVTFMVNLT